MNGSGFNTTDYSHPDHKPELISRPAVTSDVRGEPKSIVVADKWSKGYHLW